MFSRKLFYLLQFEFPKLERKIGALCSRFQGFSQQDSHEFLLYLLDGMHEELKLKSEKLTSFKEIIIKTPKDDNEQKDAYIVNYLFFHKRFRLFNFNI